MDDIMIAPLKRRIESLNKARATATDEEMLRRIDNALEAATNALKKLGVGA